MGRNIQLPAVHVYSQRGAREVRGARGAVFRDIASHRRYPMRDTSPTYIFNQSLSTGIVPVDWRLANIFPLHKKGPRDLAENYKPISFTSVCSKSLEHIVYSGISKHLENNHILSPRQHGFRPGFSCET